LSYEGMIEKKSILLYDKKRLSTIHYLIYVKIY